MQFICLDVANGYSQFFVEFVAKVRGKFPEHTIMVSQQLVFLISVDIAIDREWRQNSYPKFTTGRQRGDGRHGGGTGVRRRRHHQGEVFVRLDEVVVKFYSLGRGARVVSRAESTRVNS